MANTTIQHKRTSTVGLSPNTAQIAVGELALNLTDKRLYTSNGVQIIDLTRARPRTKRITTNSTPTPNYDTEDKFFITALATPAVIGAPAGTPEDGSLLLFRIKDSGTPQTLAWNSIYRDSIWLPLPTATTALKTMTVGFIFNSTDNKWDLLAVIDLL